MGGMRYGERGFMIMTTHPSESNNNACVGGVSICINPVYYISEMYLQLLKFRTHLIS